MHVLYRACIERLGTCRRGKFRKQPISPNETAPPQWKARKEKTVNRKDWAERDRESNQRESFPTDRPTFRSSGRPGSNSVASILFTATVNVDKLRIKQLSHPDAHVYPHIMLYIEPCGEKVVTMLAQPGRILCQKEVCITCCIVCKSLALKLLPSAILRG